MSEHSPFGPWLPRLKQGAVRLASREEIAQWILYQDDRLLVLNKPGDFVCHPSKAGPWSSLVGAVRELLGAEAAHLVFRLDRETSGVVVFAKTPAVARKLQMAAQNRLYRKTYHAILTGELAAETVVARALASDPDSPVAAKMTVVSDGLGQTAVTRFTPLATARGFTLARVTTETGRKHQIRAHAESLGFPLVGDKIYGPDARLFLDFIETGWTAALEERLLLPRQALHNSEIDLRPAGENHVFAAPLPADLTQFCRTRMGIEPMV
jgi:23S rRNA pseudouridine1911/1915/1917 synthase